MISAIAFAVREWRAVVAAILAIAIFAGGAWTGWHAHPNPPPPPTITTTRTASNNTDRASVFTAREVVRTVYVAATPTTPATTTTTTLVAPRFGMATADTSSVVATTTTRPTPAEEPASPPRVSIETAPGYRIGNGPVVRVGVGVRVVGPVWAVARADLGPLIQRKPRDSDFFAGVNLRFEW